jgi:hypothetical protein
MTFPPTQVIGNKSWVHVDDLMKLWNCSRQNCHRIATAQKWKQLRWSGYFLAWQVEDYLIRVRPNTIRHKA